MEERHIKWSQADAGFELLALEDRSLGDWAFMGADRIAWTASFKDGNSLKYGCFIQELATGKLVKKLASAGGTRGPIVTDDHIIFGGGANGATPAVFARDKFKKLGGLKGHKSELNGLIRLGDNCITLGGRNCTPFDDTVRIWDVANQSEILKVKLKGRPQTAAAVGDRIYVHTYDYPEKVALVALDTSGVILWSHEQNDEEGVGGKLVLTSDGQTLALVDRDKLTLLNADGDMQKSCSLQGAGSGKLEFSPDNRYLFLSGYDSDTQGTIVVDVERCEPVLRLHGVVRPRASGDNYGCWLCTDGAPTHFGVLPKAMIEP